MKLTDSQERVLVHLSKNSGPGNSFDVIASATKLSEDAVKKALAELREMGMISGPPTLTDKVADFLKEFDDLGPTSESYAEAAILIASLIEDADEKSLAVSLGFEPEFVHLVGSRLRASGIWTGRTLSPDRIKAWGDSSVSFYMDINVAAGKLVIDGDLCGNGTKYKLTESGLNDAANLIKRMTP